MVSRVVGQTVFSLARVRFCILAPNSCFGDITPVTVAAIQKLPSTDRRFVPGADAVSPGRAVVPRISVSCRAAAHAYPQSHRAILA